MNLKRFVLLLTLVMLASCARLPEKAPQPPSFYPPLPQKPRIQHLISISGEDDFNAPQHSWRDFFLGRTASDLRLGKLYDLAASKGKLYILDRTYKKIRVLDLKRLRLNDLPDAGPGALHNPSGIWIAPDDTKYITDMVRQQVVVFDAQDQFLRNYGSPDQLTKPVDIAVFEERIFICDTAQHRVVVLDKVSGDQLQTIGEKGTDQGQFYKPTFVTVDHLGHLFVTDAFNFRIQQFDAEGRFVTQYGFLGDNPGALARPQGIGVDREGRLYVADAAFANLQIFKAASGQLLLFFDATPKNAPTGYLPAGMHIDYDNLEYFQDFVAPDFKLEYLIYVGNMGAGEKLHIYGFGEYRPTAPQSP